MDDAPSAHRARPWTTRCVAHRRALRPHAHSLRPREIRKQGNGDNHPPVTFLREATRPAKVIVVNQPERPQARRRQLAHDLVQQYVDGKLAKAKHSRRAASEAANALRTLAAAPTSMTLLSPAPATAIPATTTPDTTLPSPVRIEPRRLSIGTGYVGSL